jgi:hypothetical protein
MVQEKQMFACAAACFSSAALRLANPRLRALWSAYAARLLVNGAGKTNVCFAAACFSFASIISREKQNSKSKIGKKQK